MASPSTVVTMGFGAGFGSVNLIPTLGFGIGVAALEPLQAYGGNADWTMLLEDAVPSPSAIPSPAAGSGSTDWSHDPRRGE